MSNTVPPSDEAYAALLSRLSATLDLDGLALETKALRRGLRSGADLLRLGLPWGPGERSLREAMAWSGLLGFAQLTDEALIQPLHKAVGFFEAITAIRCSERPRRFLAGAAASDLRRPPA